MRGGRRGACCATAAFYGPGTSMAPGRGDVRDGSASGKFPLVGDGGGVSSFIHIADAAEATVAAVERRRPRRLQRGRRRSRAGRRVAAGAGTDAGRQEAAARAFFVVRLLAGEAAVMMMTSARGASNAKAKRELAWNPAHPSWRQGSQPRDRSRGARASTVAVGRSRGPSHEVGCVGRRSDASRAVEPARQQAPDAVSLHGLRHIAGTWGCRGRAWRSWAKAAASARRRSVERDKRGRCEPPTKRRMLMTRHAPWVFLPQ